MPISDAIARFDGLAPRLFAAGMLGLGVQFLLLRDFMQAWQPVPADLPGRTGLALANAVLTILFSGAVLVGWRRRAAAVCLAALVFLWLALTDAPIAVSHANVVVAWLAVAEVAFVMCGALLLACWPGKERMPVVLETHGPLAARIVCGVALLIFGLSHFAYAKFTAGMVPAWLPERLFWAYATGAGHVAAGLSVLSGVLMRLSTRLLTLMMGSFVLLVHIPRVIATSGDAAEVKLLFAASALCGTAWILATNAARDRLGPPVWSLRPRRAAAASRPAPERLRSPAM